MLELRDITKIYNPGEITELALFRDFRLTVEDGEFLSIVGSNGSGKTSMLNIICGSIPVEKGQILIGGKDVTKIPEYKRYANIGRVYQNPATGTCPNLTIARRQQGQALRIFERRQQVKTRILQRTAGGARSRTGK